VAVLLAAGAGSRFVGSTHKLHSTLRGHSVLSHAVSSAANAGFTHVIVVWGAIEPLNTTVHNPKWQTGQASSLQVGIAAARRVGATAIVVGLGDQPFVAPADWVAVASSRSPIAQALYTQADGQKTAGNPVLLTAEVWPLLPTQGDFGARNLISSRPELVEQVLCTGSPFDIDTIEDLNQWN
jgi:molybdenum cofactor cytidylyltransferase